MNQEKIGKFIATCRKKQNLTQEELANNLGITSKAVSKWECGKGLPDASIMLDLCQILNITVNDLLSGEIVDKSSYQKKLEENIIDTIDYSNKKVLQKNKLIFKMLMLFGLILIFIAFTIYPSESSWGAVHSITGLIISTIGFANINKIQLIFKRLFLSISYFIIIFTLLIFIDYSNVSLNKVPPRFSYLIETTDKIIMYKSPLCNVYRLNRNTKNEYYIIDTKKIYTINNIPISPFNRDKSGIDNIIKYKNKYVGNNSNTNNLINNLPLSEYGYVIEINSTNLELTIHYHITDWYINNNYYLEKSLLYNTVSLFALIDNINKITFTFSGNTYTVNKTQVQELYPHFNDIISDNINKNNFNKYLENKINNNSFIEYIFKKIFIN